MGENGLEKSAGPSKSFMTVGPTLHYSHANVRRCWGLAVVIYFITCFFWLKILTGTALTLDISDLINPDSWALGRFIISPLSIYEYPWQILVLGSLMGILGVAPVLVSQLLSFRYSLPMIVGVIFIAKLPLFGIFLAISCIAVACRPLRFRSRFIAIVLCMAPQIIYWTVFGGNENVDPIRYGFSFAPWISAWLTGLAIAGAVIGVGHFTRYRPGLIWSITTLALVSAILIFHGTTGFAELDYQLYIAGNNPEELREFHDHSMTELINQAINNPDTKSYLNKRFWSKDPQELRKQLKSEIQHMLAYKLWPYWFKVPEELKYQKKRQWLLNQYDMFIDKRPTSKRMPIALYYKALLTEYSPDIRLFEQTEMLHFYSDYQHPEAQPIWDQLYDEDEFSQSLESLEARWRIAMNWAGQEEFGRAMDLCDVTKFMLEEQIKLLDKTQIASQTLFKAFAKPAQTVMTTFDLKELMRKLQRLRNLIKDNYTEDEESQKRLARFIKLNPYKIDYSNELNKILKDIQKDEPLRDNILLAKTMLISDSQLKSEQLRSLSEQFKNTDGGTRALYELGMMKVGLWKDPDKKNEDQNTYLADARAILTSFIELYPESIFTEQAQSMLKSLPEVE